ncbi:MAG: ribosomal RNA small subunit methyltransferase A [Thermoplasmata archaeon HGW-Thermoplasmata-1]|nr:MAG: ribosomal RNA small subunit methyltransferase A [Thermoplasmata archaeon HGW-Thermoplasmata-1]
MSSKGGSRQKCGNTQGKCDYQKNRRHDVERAVKELAGIGNTHVPKHHLGQNFLVDTRVADRQIRYADVKPEDTVLEIGPGHGILTKRLASKAGKVMAVEYDRDLANELRLDPELKEVGIIEGDALGVDLFSLPKFNKVVANLPYNISSPITFKLLGYPFDIAVLMYQLEFAERMTAKPGNSDYGRLTVNVYCVAECEILEKVPAAAYWPIPKVDSAIVMLRRRQSPPFELANEKVFYGMVDALFSQRRKKIRNSLTPFISRIPSHGIPAGELMWGLPYLDERPEDLSPEQLAELANMICEKTGT